MPARPCVLSALVASALTMTQVRDSGAKRLCTKQSGWYLDPICTRFHSGCLMQNRRVEYLLSHIPICASPLTSSLPTPIAIFDSIAIFRCVDILGHTIWGGRRRMSESVTCQCSWREWAAGAGPRQDRWSRRSEQSHVSALSHDNPLRNQELDPRCDSFSIRTICRLEYPTRRH